MQHRKKGRKFGVKSGPRGALRRDIVNSLFRHGRITTTVAKAKAFRPWAERMITIARTGAAARNAKDGSVTALNAYRRLVAELHDEGMVVRLIEEIAPKFADRPGGYTRILRLPKGRKGDNAPTAIFELVTFELPAEPTDGAGAAAAEAKPAKGRKAEKAAAAAE